MGYYSGTGIEGEEGPFRKRRGNKFAKDLVRRVTPKDGSCIIGKTGEEVEREGKINEMALDAWESRTSS